MWRRVCSGSPNMAQRPYYIYIETRYIDMESLIQSDPAPNFKSSKPGRKPAHDEVLEKLVEAGVEIMFEQGLRTSLNEVSFSNVVERSGVARATAYRALGEVADASPAEWLERELLKSALKGSPGRSDDDGTAAVAMRVFEDNSKRLEAGTTADFTAVLRMIIRLGCEANYDAIVNSANWTAYIAAAGAIATQGSDADSEMLDDLTASETTTIHDYAALYEMIATSFGLRIKSAYTFEQFATMLASLADGLAVRQLYSDGVAPVERPTGPDGESELWNLLGLGMEALVVSMTEPIPGVVAADLTRPDHE